MLKITAALAVFGLALVLHGAANCQKIPSKPPEAEKPAPANVASSAAYAELLLRKTEATAQLESLLADYTEEYPKVKEFRFTLEALQREIDRLAKVKPADSGRLTDALGKLIVRKVELELDVWNLLKTYKEEHPDVKRAKRKVEIYEAAIKEILG